MSVCAVCVCCMSVCAVRVCCISAGAFRVGETVLDSQEQEFQAVVSQQLWVLGTELGPFIKAIEHL